MAAKKKTTSKTSKKTSGKKTQPDFGDCRNLVNRAKRDAWRAKNAA
jgi:hypothetical protein